LGMVADVSSRLAAYPQRVDASMMDASMMGSNASYDASLHLRRSASWNVCA
jgi:hypothetical protein